MAGKLEFEQLLESRAVKYVMFDVTWCRGLTEVRKIAGMADAFELAIAPHTVGGPLLFYVSIHLSTASPSVWIRESCRWHYERDWPAMLENPIAPEGGFIRVPEEGGFGMRIEPEAWNYPAAVRQVSGRT
jgi:L-alanine-DL-glutamate epimerase-like enolase superfamily enzyme